MMGAIFTEERISDILIIEASDCKFNALHTLE